MLSLHRRLLSLSSRRYFNYARPCKNLKLRNCCFSPELTSFPPARKFHETKSNFLKLAKDETFDKWDKNYSDKYRKTMARRSKQGIKVNTNFLCLSQIRNVYFVLTKSDFVFPLPEDQSRYTDEFYDDGVLATTFILNKKFPELGSRNFIVIEDKYNSLEEWKEILEKINPDVYSRNLATTAIMEFLLLGNPSTMKIDTDINLIRHLSGELIKSYIDYLLSSEDTIEICQRSLILLFKACDEAQQHKTVETVYGRAKEKISVFGPNLVDTLLEVLPATTYWEDTFELSESVLPNLRPKYRTYNLLADCALKHGKLELGLSYINKIFDLRSSHGLTQKTFVRFLKIFKYNRDEEIWKRNRELVENLFSLYAEHLIFPHSTKLAVAIGEWFKGIENEKWEYKLLEDVDIHGQQCPFTHINLIKKKLSDEEYDILARLVFSQILNATMNKQLHSNELYTKNLSTSTSPVEMKSFMTMMYDRGPYDMVIDGLNVLYIMKTRGKKHKRTGEAGMQKEERFLGEKNVTLMLYWLRTITERRSRVVGRKLKVLVVFRQHIKKFVSADFEDVADIWYSLNTTQDDPYFLYAAMLSGEPCRLFTSDLLRNVRAIFDRVDRKHQKLLYKWQQIHQDYSAMRDGRQKRQWFDITIQKTDRTWHFPYRSDEDKYQIGTRYNPEARNWLCLKRVD